MSAKKPQPDRAGAVDRARHNSPFLRQAIGLHEDIGTVFVEHGADAAVAAALDCDRATVAATLRCQRHRLALAVGLADLAGEYSLERLTFILSDFADRAIDLAIRTAVAERAPDADASGFAIIALGKLGSNELNYSSDVDLLLLYDPAVLARRERDDPGENAVRIARRFVELLQQRTADGYVARVDLRLRPSPEVTPIALPADAAISYYESQALAWERAAFIRARTCGGDTTLGEAFLSEIQPFIWRRALDFGAIEEIGEVSRRIRDHYAQVQQFGPGFDLKRGRGGIREAEFFVQVQQLIHGGRDASVRPRATLDALAALVAAGRMEPDSAARIGDAYRVLRTAEHRVQMIADRQDHRLPAEAAALDQLASLAGLPDAEALLGWIRPHCDAVGKEFDALAGDRSAALSSDPDILAKELDGMGFREPEAVVRLIGAWRSGKARAIRSPAARSAFEAMLPSQLSAIAESADPGRALNRLADIIEKIPTGVNLFRLLEARPRMAETMALILAHAPALADQLARRPGLLDGLIDESAFAAPPDATAHAERFLNDTRDLPFDRALDRVRQIVGERRFALGVQLIGGHRDPITIAEAYSDLAEGAIVALTEMTTREFEQAHGKVTGGEFIVLGLGRLGGRALTHASDLDLIYLYDAPEGEMSDGARSLSPTDYYNRLASRVTSALGVQTAAGPLYDVDTRLRPQGGQGMLAVSLAGFETYQLENAWTWEHMALCRARPLTGSDAMRERTRRLIFDILSAPTHPLKVVEDAATMRAEMERHKPPAGALDVKLGPGGLVDLEFAVHALQLTRHIGLDPRLEIAIAELSDAGLIDDQADADLRLLSGLLVVLRLVATSKMEPASASRQLVANLCGHDDWEQLLTALSMARQRIADRWDRIRDER
ncbi:MAG TPA: bifunctional [glutamine synthetase] adenylyltransferase/[glutamine synthetase]-adenylyl-L-tyrosine phosphorylase [Sphingomicrobium sp.]|nr:bifunctional [glutamine synthetase] adenylyltransferase/[glutamine synthetase]-adenylyl-L-tyrosine phosphorylase [Sphingomicrobium sp.]